MMKNNKKFSFIRYSNCWEDTNILLSALNIGCGETGLSIVSAGDNTLALLISNPKRVYAFDINNTQLFCLELKMACFKLLDYEEMLQFLGIGNCDRIAVFEKLAPALSEEARLYFEKNLKIIKKGIIHTGKFEHFFKLFRQGILPLVCGKKTFSAFSELSDLDEQKEFYSRKVNTLRFKTLFGIIFGYKFLGNLGRDKDFYKYVDEKEQSGSDIKKRFEYGISNSVNNTNPYLCYIANGNYRKNALPLYLQKQHFDTIRKNIDNITLIHGDLNSVSDMKFDFLNLSDIFEYMSEDEFLKNEKKLLSITNPGARIAYWNMQNKRYLNQKKFLFDDKKSNSLFKKNQSWFYRDFMLYRKMENE